MTNKCLIEQSKRTRVNGTGPRRNKLKLFHKIGTVSNNTLSELNSILNLNTSNDIGSDNYAISANCNYEEVFHVGETYRQVLLQKNPLETINTIDEYMYSDWDNRFNTEETRKDIFSYLNQVYRFRLSEMKQNHTMNWHIDADTSVICRAQICLNENTSIYESKDKTGIHTLHMKPGELWFINTGWLHRVVNGNSDRRVAVFGFHFNDLLNSNQLLLA